MEITEIKRVYDLYKMVTKEENVAITDLAKEMGVKVTKLMGFILENPRHFIIEEKWTYKKKTISYTSFGTKHIRTETVKDKCKGLGITEIFIETELNYKCNVLYNRHTKVILGLND